jgi:lysozyme family protein
MDMFPAAVSIVLLEEGVISDDAAGGVTKYGIARKEHQISDAAWASFTKDDAIALYKAQYWTPHNLDGAPWPWALALFEAVVNPCGGSSLKLAQRALHTTADGEIGAETLKLMHEDEGDALRSFLAYRADSYTHSQQYDLYGHGWLARLFKTAQRGQQVPS